MICVFVILLLFTADGNGKIYFKEEFNDAAWEDIWTHSEHQGIEWGKFVLTAGNFFGDPNISKGIKTSEDARFYGLSAKFEPFSNKNSVLVVQFSVKHEQNLDCGGGYIKLFDCSLEPRDLHGSTPYLIMFGPDICGYEKKVQIIFNYKDKNLPIKNDIQCKSDEFTHLYTLIVKPDHTYAVKIDNVVVQEGELENDWDFLLPRTIKDPDVQKPEDWVDNPDIVDPNDVKPEDWDRPEYVPDKEAVKPVDWDDDMDGEWEPPQVNNPEFKGEWKPRLLSNVNYKGPWIHPEIANPDYVPDPDLHVRGELCAVGFDLWQVRSGSVFDNILITDDEHEARKHADATWGAIKDKEKAMRNMDSEKETDDDDDDDDDDESQEWDKLSVNLDSDQDDESVADGRTDDQDDEIDHDEL